MSPTYLLIRWTHVVAVSMLVGGAALLSLTWFCCLTPRGHNDSLFCVDLARRFEWAFWGLFGIAVITGAGNLGAFAEGLPSPNTIWGQTFVLKMIAAGLFLSFSLIRTCVLTQVALVSGVSLASKSRYLIGGLYGGSVLVGLTLIGMGVFLSHG